MPGRPLCRALELKEALTVLLITAWKEMAGLQLPNWVEYLAQCSSVLWAGSMCLSLHLYMVSALGLVTIYFLCAHLWSKGQMRLAV